MFKLFVNDVDFKVLDFKVIDLERREVSLFEVVSIIVGICFNFLGK